MYEVKVWSQYSGNEMKAKMIESRKRWNPEGHIEEHTMQNLALKDWFLVYAKQLGYTIILDLSDTAKPLIPLV